VLSSITDGLDFYERVWRPSELVVSNMERLGIELDVGRCPEERAKCLHRAAELAAWLDGWAGSLWEINWGSPKQLSEYLYEVREFPLPPVSGTQRAVKVRDEDEAPTGGAALRYLADHLPDPQDRAAMETLLAWKDVTKLGSFWATLPKYVRADGRIHPQLGPNTETGRLSCRNPNLQQQPKTTRAAFRARRGHLLVALDYDALEWRVLAHVLVHKYKDTSLLDEVVAGVDPHAATAVRMGLCSGPVEQVKERYPKARDAGKILNYSINYGKTGRGLGAQIRDEAGNGVGEERGQELLDGFYEARPGVARFHRDIVQYAKATGGVRSLLGRYRAIPELEDERRWMQYRGERLAKNVIQNCATDIVVMAMLRVNTDKQLEHYNAPLDRLGCRLILQNHDALVFEVPKENAAEARAQAADVMAHCMEGVREFRCPLSVSGGIGETWAEAEKG
jgi:DNA polymerase-1